MDNSVIAKSGWLYRQTSVMKKWKKSWVELYRDGHLKHYESEQSPNADDVIFMPTDCIAVRTGLQVGVQPPEDLAAQSLLSISTSTGKNWVFCGENVDDMRSWQLALEHSRLSMHQSAASTPYVQYGPNTYVTPPQPQAPASSYAPPLQYYPPPQQYYPYAQPSPAYMAAPPPTTTVVYQPDRYYYSPGTDIALGMMTGAALGHLMWAPMGCWW